ncbi:hypothetical protein KEJ43_02375 [Candidatus Bathyarchaeota archaeon]|nr:hypothetical protein [Candidatus Bathyarchaeota archaeon]
MQQDLEGYGCYTPWRYKRLEPKGVELFKDGQKSQSSDVISVALMRGVVVA